MKYSQEEFFDLMERVENEGGEHLDDICGVRQYTFSGPHTKPLTDPGHGEVTLFKIPYLHEDDSTAGELTVCAVDDDMGRWPRYGGDRFGR